MKKKRFQTTAPQLDIAESLLMLGAGWLTLRGAEPEEVAAVVARTSEAVKRACARIDALNVRIVETVLGVDPVEWKCSVCGRGVTTHSPAECKRNETQHTEEPS